MSEQTPLAWYADLLDKLYKSRVEQDDKEEIFAEQLNDCRAAMTKLEQDEIKGLIRAAEKKHGICGVLVCWKQCGMNSIKHTCTGDATHSQSPEEAPKACKVFAQEHAKRYPDIADRWIAVGRQEEVSCNV